MPSKVGEGITYSFPNFNGFMMDVITYPCWDKSVSMLVKGALVLGVTTMQQSEHQNTKHNLKVRVSVSVCVCKCQCVYSLMYMTKSLIYNGLQTVLQWAV